MGQRMVIFGRFALRLKRGPGKCLLSNWRSYCRKEPFFSGQKMVIFTSLRLKRESRQDCTFGPGEKNRKNRKNLVRETPQTDPPQQKKQKKQKKPRKKVFFLFFLFFLGREKKQKKQKKPRKNVFSVFSVFSVWGGRSGGFPGPVFFFVSCLGRESIWIKHKT